MTSPERALTSLERVVGGKLCRLLSLLVVVLALKRCFGGRVMQFTVVIASFAAAAAAAVIGMIRASRNRRHVLPRLPGSISRGASVYRPSMFGSTHQTEDVGAATVCGEL